MANRKESQELVLIQVRVPKKTHKKLIELQKKANDFSLAAYTRRALIEHTERK